MTRKTANYWLAVSAILIAASVILFLLPVSSRKDRKPYDLRESLSFQDTILVVTDIIDGDTFVLSESIQVRLIGVDTPEKGQPFFHEARAYAESVLSGSSVRLEYDEELLDNYGRRLAYLFIDTSLFNANIVRNGLASVYLFPRNNRFASRFIEAQKQARRDRIGIWSLDDPSPEEYYVGIPGSLRFHRPLCPHLKKSDPANLLRYSSRREPLDLGLSSCRFCRP